MNEIVKILAPFAASENGKYNSPRKKLYCVWQMPTGVYVANPYIIIKVKTPCEIVQGININLKYYEKFSAVPLKSIEVDHNFNADKEILGSDGILRAIFNNPPDIDGLLKENKKGRITLITPINVNNTLKNIPKGCEYVVINDTVFNAFFFTSILKVFKKLGDKEIDIVFRDKKHFSVEFVSNKIDALLMPIYHLDILSDMEQKHKENNNHVIYL